MIDSNKKLKVILPHITAIITIGTTIRDSMFRVVFLLGSNIIGSKQFLAAPIVIIAVI